MKMRLYLNFILTIIAICLVIIVFKINDIPSKVYAYGDSPVEVKIVGIKSYMLDSLPVEINNVKIPLPVKIDTAKTSIPVEIVSIKKPDTHTAPTFDLNEYNRIRDLKWDRIPVDND